WAWAYLSAARSSKPMADGCGRSRANREGPSFSFRSPLTELPSVIDVAYCAGFRMPGCRDHPHARRAGVRKAPRQEIAGCGAPTVQRALWGFDAGVSVGEVEPTLAIGSL